MQRAHLETSARMYATSRTLGFYMPSPCALQCAVKVVKCRYIIHNEVTAIANWCKKKKREGGGGVGGLARWKDSSSLHSLAPSAENTNYSSHLF